MPGVYHNYLIKWYLTKKNGEYKDYLTTTTYYDANM